MSKPREKSTDRSALHWSMLLMACANASACEAGDSLATRPPEAARDVAKAEQPISNFDAYYFANFDESCDTFQQNRILNALWIVRQQIVFNWPTMINCLKEVTFQSPPAGAGREGRHAEWVIEKLTWSTTVVPFRCDLPPFATFAAGLWEGSRIWLMPEFIRTASLSHLAAVIAHEAAHMSGFLHTPDVDESLQVNGNGGLGAEQRTSIPYEVQYCLEQIADWVTVPKPSNFVERRVSDFALEAALQPIGDPNGVPDYMHAMRRDFRTGCLGNHFAKGLTLGVGDGIQSLELPCIEREGVWTSTSPVQGDPRADINNIKQHCYSGEVMVGLWGQAGIGLNSVGPVCAPTSEVIARAQATRYFDPTHGLENSYDPFWYRLCPPGQAVRAVRGHFRNAPTGDVRNIDTLQVVCQNIDQPQSLAFTYQGGFTSSSVKGETAVECQGRGALFTLSTMWDGTRGHGVTRLGGLCANFQGHGYQGNLQRLSETHLFPGIGGGGSEVQAQAQDWCPQPDGVLVGLEVNLDTNQPNPLRGVRGLCAKQADWGAGGASEVPVERTTTRGTADGYVWSPWTCNRGEFLTGFVMKGDRNFEQLQLICRDFR